jgi:hypothetical protein
MGMVENKAFLERYQSKIDSTMMKTHLTPLIAEAHRAIRAILAMNEGETAMYIDGPFAGRCLLQIMDSLFLHFFNHTYRSRDICGKLSILLLLSFLLSFGLRRATISR